MTYRRPPGRAEDLDTGHCSKPSRALTLLVNGVFVGVGVQGGDELVAVGLQIKFVVEVCAHKDVKNLQSHQP